MEPQKLEPMRAPLRSRRLLAFAGAAALALAIGAAALLGGGESDSVSAADAAARSAAFNQAVAGGVSLKLVPAPERDRAMQLMKLDPTSAAQLQADVERGAVKLAYVRVWDDMDEDGDVLEISSAGFSLPVLLTKAGTLLAVPVVSGQPITFTGARDGQGGITAGIEVQGGAILTPVLRPGQAVSLPVR